MDAEAHVRALGEGQVAAGSRRVELGAIGSANTAGSRPVAVERDMDEIALAMAAPPSSVAAVA